MLLHHETIFKEKGKEDEGLLLATSEMHEAGVAHTSLNVKARYIQCKRSILAPVPWLEFHGQIP